MFLEPDGEYGGSWKLSGRTAHAPQRGYGFRVLFVDGRICLCRSDEAQASREGRMIPTYLVHLVHKFHLFLRRQLPNLSR